MSDMENPYQSPATDSFPAPPAIPQGNLTETMLIYLKGASPWLRFIGIVGFVIAGFTVLWGLAIFFIFILSGSIFGSLLDDFQSIGLYSGIFSAIGGAAGLFTIGGAAVIFFPALFTYRFGDRIRKYLQTGTDSELEEAFKNNRSLWKFNGIVIIISMAFIPVSIIISIIIAVSLALSW